MEIKTVPTFIARVYLGLKLNNSDFTYDYSTAEYCVQRFVDRTGECVTVTRTRYVYTNGAEDGIIIEFINYPRFPRPDEVIRKQALDLAKELQDHFMQVVVSVAFPDETIMYREEKYIAKDDHIQEV